MRYAGSPNWPAPAPSWRPDPPASPVAEGGFRVCCRRGSGRDGTEHLTGMIGTDLPMLLALAAITAYFIYKRWGTLRSGPGHGLLAAGLMVLTLTVLVDWLMVGLDRVLAIDLDPVLGSRLVVYLGYVPGILAIGAGMTMLLPSIDRLAAEISARGEAEEAAKQRARDLQAAKLEAEAADAAKGRFLASMSHELRTPLNAIIGFAELLQQQSFGRLGDERYTDFARDIEHSGRHLLAIINDILDMSKIESGKERLQETELELGTVIDGAVRMVQADARRLGLTLDVDRNLTDCHLFADEVKLSRVLVNLLSNAIKFTERGGTVALRTRLRGNGALQVTVTDTGIGMSPPEIDVALTPFGQVGAIHGRLHQGTGLGLPISKAVIELHGGSFEVRSEPGKGTAVSFTLPAERVIGGTGRAAGE